MTDATGRYFHLEGGSPIGPQGDLANLGAADVELTRGPRAKIDQKVHDLVGYAHQKYRGSFGRQSVRGLRGDGDRQRLSGLRGSSTMASLVVGQFENLTRREN